MSTATNANMTSVPVVTHAGVDTAGLSEKVAIRNLEFFYGDARALKSISLPLYANKTTAFIGPSGCGKSTLLRVLNRMYDLYPGQRATGEVLFDGANLLDPGQDINLLRARIGMVFQKPTPFPMSIYENIAFGVRLYERLPRAEMDARVESALRRAALWDEVKDKLDLNRVFFVGRVPYADYLRVLQVSACHVYLTVPFVLGWSCIEAMSVGAPVVGSDTAPVREVITHGQNGLLVDFFDTTSLARTVVAVLSRPQQYSAMRRAARATVLERYDLLTHCLPKQVALVDRLANASKGS